jgi:hypothetical protein
LLLLLFLLLCCDVERPQASRHRQHCRLRHDKSTDSSCLLLLLLLLVVCLLVSSTHTSIKPCTTLSLYCNCFTVLDGRHYQKVSCIAPKRSVPFAAMQQRFRECAASSSSCSTCALATPPAPLLVPLLPLLMLLLAVQQHLLVLLLQPGLCCERAGAAL